MGLSVTHSKQLVVSAMCFLSGSVCECVSGFRDYQVALNTYIIATCTSIFNFTVFGLHEQSLSAMLAADHVSAF